MFYVACDSEAMNIARQNFVVCTTYLETNGTGGDNECQTLVPWVLGSRGIPDLLLRDREYRGEVDICLRLASTDD